jgi:hypothetical protein
MQFRLQMREQVGARQFAPTLSYASIALLDLLHKSEKLTISNFGFWILDFGLRDLGLLQEVYSSR